MQEHIYIIPLRDARRMPRWKRSNGAIKDIRKYLVAFANCCYQNPSSICPQHQMMLPRIIKG